MNNDEILRKKVMRQVHGVYMLRVFMHPRAHLIGLAILAFALTLSVSIKDVLANTITSTRTFSSFVHYVTDAIVTTEFIVQVFMLLAGVLLALIVRDICVYCVSHGVFMLRKQTQPS